MTTPLVGSDLVLFAEAGREGEQLLLTWSAETGEQAEQTTAFPVTALREMRRAQKSERLVAGRVLSALRV